MSHRSSSPHPSAEQLQAFLDGELPGRAARPVEEHLSSCARCAAEVEAFRSLYEEIEALPRLVPLEGFSERVIRAVGPQPVPLAARVRRSLAALLPPSHPDASRIQDFVEGLLAAPAAARVSHHLGRCPRCAGEADAWRTLLEGLDGLDHLAPAPGFAGRVMDRRALEAALDGLGRLAPSEGFAARVMAGVRLPAPMPAPVSAWGRLLAAARQRLPEPRQAWAAVSGVAVTPVVTLGLVAWAVFSHPTLTPGALLAFVGWKVTDLATLAWTALQGAALESVGTFQLVSAIQSALASPTALAAGFLLFSICTVAALWVLYRNLVASHPRDGGRYAHASL